MNNRRYKQLIIQPFLKAVEDIHLLSGNALKIEIPTYEGIDEFLNSHVVVTYDKAVADYYNTKKKEKNIEKKTRGKLNDPKRSESSKRVSKRAAG